METAIRGRSSVRVVVVGDHGTGKSSLINTVATETFLFSVSPVVPPAYLSAEDFPDEVPVTIIDTSSRPEDRHKVAQECKLADAVVLTYACDRPETLDRLSTFWLPELRRLEVKVPVIVVGCKLDLRDDQQPNPEQVMSPIMQQFREIVTCIECSALEQIQVYEVVYYAQKAVLHPIAPLFDQERQTLKSSCVRALKRIFFLCDRDKDGALSDQEINDFQVRCFNAPMQPLEIMNVKKVVRDKLPEGVNHRGLTLTGFLFLHALFIEKGRMETTWTVLRKFGYDNDLKLRDDVIPSDLFKRAPDENIELSSQALDFLRRIFSVFDVDGDGVLRPSDVEKLFSTAPENPWDVGIYKDAVERNALGGLTLNGFLSQWALMTLLDPVTSLANLIYIGYAGDPSSAFHVTQRRLIDRQKKQSQRNVFQCFVFGPESSGKSSLLNAFVGKPFTKKNTQTVEPQFAANVVQHGATKKTLVLRAIPTNGVRSLLSDKDSLAACDVAVFIYDSSVESSGKKMNDLLIEVASFGEENGIEIPSLIVAVKDDLYRYPTSVQDSTKASQETGIEGRITISVKLRDINKLFHEIINAAQHPHSSIPETEDGRKLKQYCRIINRSLMFVSVGAAITVVGLAAYRAYAAHRHSSG